MAAAAAAASAGNHEAARHSGNQDGQGPIRMAMAMAKAAKPTQIALE